MRIPSNADSSVAEFVTFKLADGVDQNEFLKAARNTVAFVDAAPGFISRRLSKDENGLWTDYVLWADMNSAMAAAKAIMSEPAAEPFMQAIDPNSVTMRHATVALSMGK